MRVLFCDFDEKWHVEILQKLSDRLSADYVVSIANINHKLENKACKCIWINNADLNYHRYDEFLTWDLPALDAELLEKLSWCESLYYSMLDRSELVMSKSISYKERKQCYHNDLRIMLHLLKQVDVCIFSSIPHVGFDYVLYGLCRVLNVPYVVQHFCPVVPGVSSVYFFQDIFDHLPEMKEIDYASINTNDELPDRMKAYYAYYGREKGEIKQLIELSDFDEEYKKPGLMQKIHLAFERSNQGLLGATIRRRVKNKIATCNMNRYFEKNCYNPQKEKYIYFPLHYQPECTSLPMGGVYHDQELVIEQLSKYVPQDVKIYVKPHPYRSWFADEKFYDQIRSYRNVCLVPPKYNSYELMDSAMAVVSLTGTAILEALIRNTPVLMFGYYIWQYTPGVFHCRSCDDVKNALEKICIDGVRPDESLIKNFFVELDKYVYEGSQVASINKICGLSFEISAENIVNGYISFLNKIGVQSN